MKKISKIIKSIDTDDKIIEIFTNHSNNKFEIIEYKVPVDPKALPGTSDEKKYLKYLLTKYREAIL